MVCSRHLCVCFLVFLVAFQEGRPSKIIEGRDTSLEKIIRRPRRDLARLAGPGILTAGPAWVGPAEVPAQATHGLGALKILSSWVFWRSPGHRILNSRGWGAQNSELTGFLVVSRAQILNSRAWEGSRS